MSRPECQLTLRRHSNTDHVVLTFLLHCRMRYPCPKRQGALPPGWALQVGFPSCLLRRAAALVPAPRRDVCVKGLEGGQMVELPHRQAGALLVAGIAGSSISPAEPILLPPSGLWQLAKHMVLVSRSFIGNRSDASEKMCRAQIILHVAVKR